MTLHREDKAAVAISTALIILGITAALAIHYSGVIL